MRIDSVMWSTLLDRGHHAERRLLQSLSRVCRSLESHQEVPLDTAQLIYEYLAVVRHRAKLHRVYEKIEAIWLEISTLDSILMWVPTNDPLFEGLKDILLQAENGDVKAVIKTVRRMQEVRRNEISERQSAIAKKPRSNPFSKILDELVSENPRISMNEVLKRLRRLVGGGVIRNISNGVIEVDVLEPEYYANIEVARLKDHLHRAKQRHKKIIALAG